MTDAAPDACPYCEFPVHAAGIAQCSTCGGTLREVSPGTWAPLVRYQGAPRIRDLEQRIDRVRRTLGASRGPCLTRVALCLLFLGGLELVLARLGAWARLAGHADAFFLVVMAAGLVAFAIYMIADAAMTGFRQDRARRRALSRLRSQRNLARRRTSDAYMRRVDHRFEAVTG